MKLRLLFGKLLLLFLATLFAISCTPTISETEQLKKLFEKSNFVIEPFTADSVFSANFEVQFKQEIVPGMPDSGYFTQRIYVSHKGFDKPTVIITEGYTANNYYYSELAKLLDANQIIVEHRYFGESVPANKNWQHLNMKNAAADHHAIIEFFKQVYKGAWVSTGISKGGQTTLYHKYLYPTDVQASVPYVAPLNFSDKEPRVFEFLNQVADEASRKKILAFQNALLDRREELMPKFMDNAKKNNYTFSIGADMAFEYSVLEYPFAFWQWGYLNANNIPEPTAP
ncbi:MAG TPA: aminopeptidase, partial [Bacteroidales bacterium]|nr:aminopeptidase [Bacteroidales bacterium]